MSWRCSGRRGVCMGRAGVGILLLRKTGLRVESQADGFALRNALLSGRAMQTPPGKFRPLTLPGSREGFCSTGAKGV